MAPQAVADKANEITAIPDLLARLEVQGAWVAIDAIGGPKAIARHIVEAGAEYVLALKDIPSHATRRRSAVPRP
jgi:predicted transposase YbfD/YdcC